MNMKALIPIADGSEEIESVTVIDILRRAGVDVTVAVIGPKDNDQITAARGTKVVGDCGITDCKKETWDAIVIPGGIEGASAIANCKIFHKILEMISLKEEYLLFRRKKILLTLFFNYLLDGIKIFRRKCS